MPGYQHEQRLRKPFEQTAKSFQYRLFITLMSATGQQHQPVGTPGHANGLTLLEQAWRQRDIELEITGDLNPLFIRTDFNEPICVHLTLGGDT